MDTFIFSNVSMKVSNMKKKMFSHCIVYREKCFFKLEVTVN